MDTQKRLLNIKEASQYLSIPKGSLYTMISLKKIPAECIVKIGRALRFEKSALDNWVNENKKAI